MHIAIDVHSLGSRAAGNETYFQQLLRGLCLDKSDHRYTLFYTNEGVPERHPLDPRFQWVRVSQNRIARMCISLPAALRRSTPDVFHCQYARPFFTSTRTIVAIHDLAYEHVPKLAHPLEVAAMKRMVRAAARNAACVVTLSSFSARDIEKTYGIPEEKIEVTYLAAADRFQPRDRVAARQMVAHNYKIESPFILYVGRIQARKNLARLLDAYATLRAQGPAPKLVMVGKQDFGFEVLQKKIDTLALRDSVVFPGYVTDADLPLFYNGAEFFVFPSLFEGFGLPVLEAMASGTPTITSQGSALEEVAGDSALIIDPNDTQTLVRAMKSLMSDSGLRRQLSERGLRRSAEFTIEKFAAKILQVYADVGSR